jgi:PAS domain S-box-containing protein
MVAAAPGSTSTEFDRVFDSLPVAACLIDRSGRILAVNALARSRWNLARVGDVLHDALQHLDTDGARLCAQEECVLRHPPISAELRREREAFRRSDGSLMVFDWLSAPWPGSGNAAIVLLRDITDRYRQEQDAARQQRLLDRAQQIARLGSWEWDISTDVVTWSPQLYRVFGVTRDTAIDYAHYMSRIHPEDRALVTDTIDRALERHQAYSVQHRIVRDDGDVRVIHSLGEVVLDETGRPARLIGTAQDVTERVDAERRAFALAREQFSRAAAERDRARLRQIFDQVPASISVLSGDDQQVEVANSRAEALGEPDPEVLDRVSRTGRPHVSNELPVTIGGKEHFFTVVYQPISAADGSVESILSFGIDVTDQVRTTRDLLAATRARDQALVVLAAERRRLEMINRELDQFAYAASHDLKAPLRGIANLAQWIEEDLQDQLNEGTREMLALMRSRMHRMEALIEGLLQFSRAGRVHDKPEHVDTGALVEDLVELLAPPEDTLIFIAPDMPTLSAERLPLQQVFSNLIGNAIKYTGGRDARIFVDVADIGDMYEFAVTDNGPGIAPEFHERVWGIFQSLQPHDKVEGTGIGLALVQKIVEARGGRVALASRPGEGSRFSFSWPKNVAHEDA